MARSHSIYVVCKLRDRINEPVAAFTVKHELATFLSKPRDFPVFVLRFRDNQPAVPPTEMSED